MATNNYTSKTAALKATIADINKLNTKKLKVNGKDVVLGAKHANDTRETITDDDLWGQWIETLEDGTAIVHDDWITNHNASSNAAWNYSITKVKDNKAYVGDDLYGNIQTEMIKNGDRMFYSSQLSQFSSDLSSLTDGFYMFSCCSNLTSFSSDLSSLTNGEKMF